MQISRTTIHTLSLSPGIPTNLNSVTWDGAGFPEIREYNLRYNTWRKKINAFYLIF